MSAIATFTLLPVSSANNLRDAAVPKILLGKPEDSFHRFLRESGTPLSKYEWSGYFIATLLPYLEQERDISFTNSEFDDLETFITNVRGTSSFVLTNFHREQFLEKLDPTTFLESELKEYFEKFNETENPESGRAMLDGIAVIQRNLSQVRSDTFILLIVG
jgi:hypothetical protein